MDKIKEAAAMYKWENHNKYTALQRDALVTGFEAGATSEAAREYWEGQKDEEIARLKDEVADLEEELYKLRG